MVTIIVATFLLVSGAVAGDGSPSADRLEGEVGRLMTEEDVKGLTLVVIDDGTAVHVAAYGQRNIERDLPLETDTVMYGASLTKTEFAYMVLQLVDEGSFDLDRPLHTYLQQLPDYEGYGDLTGAIGGASSPQGTR